MDNWAVLLSIFFGLLMLLLFLRVPVAYALLTINFGAAAYLFGIEAGLRQLVLSLQASLTNFSLLPILLFVIMGEVLFRSGVVDRTLGILDQALRRLPARLAILSTIFSGFLGLLSGSTLANTAMLGRTLLPTMVKQGYSLRLGMGSIIAGGGLAMIIPPSALAVVWGATAGVPIGPLLIAGILPGALMMVHYGVISTVWARAFAGAPRQEEQPVRVPLPVLAGDILKYMLPLTSIIVVILGTMFSGLGTPTEAAALGAVASFVLVAGYRKLNLTLVKEALEGTLRVTTMIFFILGASTLYSQVMSFSGATSGLVNSFLKLADSPMITMAIMLVIVLIMGCFLDQIAIMLVTLPFFMPVVDALHWDPIWFGILMLIAIQIGLMTPPFGLGLFVMKGVAPEGTRLSDCYIAAFPYVLGDCLAITIIIIFPGIATWLPGLMSS
jgi:tripartite ATP-independent transporter DctM subunit